MSSKIIFYICSDSWNYQIAVINKKLIIICCLRTDFQHPCTVASACCSATVSCFPRSTSSLSPGSPIAALNISYKFVPFPLWSSSACESTLSRLTLYDAFMICLFLCSSLSFGSAGTSLTGYLMLSDLVQVLPRANFCINSCPSIFYELTPALSSC